MHANSYGRKRPQRWPVVIATLSAISLPFLAAAAEQTAEQVRFADLSAYDCAGASARPDMSSRHIGQVIQSRYHEWYALYGQVDGTLHLLCISKLRPEARLLTREEAASFLVASSAIGVPNTSPAPRDRSQAVEDMPPEPDDVKPEPVKRLRPQPPGTEQLPGLPELPPLPASRAGDGAGVIPAPETRVIEPGAPQPSAAAGETEKPATIGVDDRVVVANTTSYPWNTVGFLVSTYGGQSYRCTGTLVSPYTLLTAGHCIHNNSRGGYATQVRFYPGQYQDNLGDNTPRRPYGGKTDFAFLHATQTWAEVSGQEAYPATTYRHDFAVVQFRTPFTFTGTFTPVIFDSTDGPITSAGYPATVSGQTAYGMYADSGVEVAPINFHRNNHIREFAVDASGGNSGGPFFFVDPATGQRSLVGSLSYGDDLDDESGGPWYDSWNRALITSWMAWSPDASASASGSSTQISSVHSSTQTSLQSYLRFYNSGGTGGNITATLADAATGNTLAVWTSPNLPAGSSLQFSMRDIETASSPSFTKPTFYSLAVRSTFPGHLQHVLWNFPASALSNLTSCGGGVNAGVKVLMNVHSSRLQAGYPSTVVIHNTGPSPVDVALGIYDARYGNRLGTYDTGMIGANALRSVSVAGMEAAAHITPGTTMSHYVIKADTAFTGQLQHLVTNSANGVIVDMTGMCPLSP